MNFQTGNNKPLGIEKSAAIVCPRAHTIGEASRKILNSIIAGGLVLCGAYSSGNVGSVSIIAALAASIAAFLTQLKTEIENEENKIRAFFAWF